LSFRGVDALGASLVAFEKLHGGSLSGIIRGVTPNPPRKAGERRKLVPTYVTLWNWTDQGIRNVRDTVERVDRASEMAEEKYGVMLGQIYWTVGSYDLVSVFEAPDGESVSAFLLELGSIGNVRSTTLRAYNRDEMSTILERLGPAAAT
jgi:uncharacterized protein with GYD domain